MLVAAPGDNMGLLLLVAPPLALLLTWRRGGLARLGFRRPSSWPKLIATSVLAGVVIQGFSVFGVEPLAYALTGQKADISAFAGIEGNLVATVTMLLLIWTLVAFGEEIVFRGFLLAELQRLLGPGVWSSGAALVFSSTLFGLGHWYQGLSGVFITTLVGALVGALFLASRRNLWLVILTHGMIDTVAVGILYLGRYEELENWSRNWWL